MPLYDKAFWGILFLTAGIIAAAVPLRPAVFIAAAFILFSAAFLAALLSDFSSRRLWLAGLTLLSLVGYGYSFAISDLNKENLPTAGIPISLTGTVVGGTLSYERSESFLLRLNSPYRGLVSVYVNQTENLTRGDRLSVTGVLFISPSGRPLIRWPSVSILEHPRGFLNLLSRLRQNIIDSFRRALPPAPAALLSGLVLGDRSGFTPAFRDSLATSGTTHLVALSGYNITILISAFGAALGAWLSRRLTFIATFTAIVFFVIMVGPEPSIVRAAVMGGIALLALAYGRLYSVRNAIAVSALLMLIADPSAFFSVGFELSFLALLGIVYLMPALSELLGWDEKTSNSFFNWRGHLLTTISAQLAVAPLLFYYFHSVSVLSILSNLLVLGTVPYTMFFGGLLAAAGIFGAAGNLLTEFISLPANLILTYQIGVIEFFSSLSFGRLSSEFGRLGLLLAFLYYLALVLIIIRYYHSLRPPLK